MEITIRDRESGEDMSSTIIEKGFNPRFNDHPKDTANDISANDIAFWFSEILCLLIGIACLLGNGLVLYVSSSKVDTGRFQHINAVVRNLAGSDFLFGLIGIPLLMYWWWLGKKF